MELDQLILYAESSQIDAAMVQKLTSEFFRYEPFDLTRALGRKDIPSALQIFRFLYDLTGDTASVVGLLHWQLKRIWQAKKVLAEGGLGRDVSQVCGIPPFRLAAFLEEAKRFELSSVEKLLEALWKIDWGVKKGNLQETAALEAFLASV